VLPLQALAMALEQGIPMHKITVSSDAGGSLPAFEGDRLITSEAASPDVLLKLLLDTAGDSDGMFGHALAAVTRNPAAALSLRDRGGIATGAYADLLLLDLENKRLDAVMCNGQWLHQS